MLLAEILTNLGKLTGLLVVRPQFKPIIDAALNGQNAIILNGRSGKDEIDFSESDIEELRTAGLTVIEDAFDSVSGGYFTVVSWAKSEPAARVKAA